MDLHHKVRVLTNHLRVPQRSLPKPKRGYGKQPNMADSAQDGPRDRARIFLLKHPELIRRIKTRGDVDKVREFLKRKFEDGRDLSHSPSGSTNRG